MDPPTADDVSIALAGTQLDTPSKLIVDLERSTQPAKPQTGNVPADEFDAESVFTSSPSTASTT